MKHFVDIVLFNHQFKGISSYMRTFSFFQSSDLYKFHFLMDFENSEKYCVQDSYDNSLIKKSKKKNFIGFAKINGNR